MTERQEGFETIREQLDELNFDWDTAHIRVWLKLKKEEEEYEDSTMSKELREGLDKLKEKFAYQNPPDITVDGVVYCMREGDRKDEKIFDIDKDHEILDIPFYTSYGSQTMPPIVATDKDYIYTVHEYDGSESFQKVRRDISKYEANIEDWKDAPPGYI